MTDAIETLARLYGAKLDISRDEDNKSWTITIDQCHYFCGHSGQKLSALANAVAGRQKLSETHRPKSVETPVEVD